jgi:hypothetical protein
MRANAAPAVAAKRLSTCGGLGLRRGWSGSTNVTRPNAELSDGAKPRSLQ